ncbi:inosine/uridine-preferring nucleoside hydrolase [Verticillium alfalfae VaMs.102]|uniref:Inosine/uridine-preferring nucleoside hydrolase n=1 Tax=Verticillium alfalfae (strain VaMs.102 / ATCC MYA-4576 / FGSC 10136) TaxID=526221 RepID=C9SZ85_VERA1|nr:inosine/uridine-preferring nucleoside hydrolase [Verticillium alfalfae VaMs.102]EEY24100.1 inosine/uridine-preferring nucleoside hydrolase [Verticillium alfalfae VaMs.102]
MYSSFLAIPAASLIFLNSLGAARKNLILDTDLFSDCDDAAALLLAATSPDIRLLAVNVNSPSLYSTIATSAILAHYGQANIPIGARRPQTNDTFFDSWGFEFGEFTSKIAYHWSGGSLPWGQAHRAWDPVDLYRKTLAASEDGSVTVVSLGFFANLAALLDSPADGYSELTGPELLSAKVSELVIMGGVYPSGREFNFWGDDPLATAHVVNDFTGRMVFSGFELGQNVTSGLRLMANGPVGDPVRAAYIYYTHGQPHQSWDPISVLYAIRGLGDIFEYGNDNGYNHVHANGSNTWIHDDRIRNQHWLKLKANNETVGDELDRLYLQAAWVAASPVAKADLLWVPHLPRHPKAEL